MLKLRPAGVWLAIVSIALATQGCWEDEQDQLTLLGDGGCRIADGGTGDPTYSPEMSLEECKAQCLAANGQCTAVEFNANNGMCEVHSEPIAKFERVDGVACYVMK
jgi:hypothetical protein